MINVIKRILMSLTLFILQRRRQDYVFSLKIAQTDTLVLCLFYAILKASPILRLLKVLIIKFQWGFMKKGVFVYIAYIVIVLSVVVPIPAISFSTDSALTSCQKENPSAEINNICKPIVINTEREIKCPNGYSLEASDEKKPGAVQLGNNFFRCIPRKPGMPGYIISDKKKSESSIWMD